MNIQISEHQNLAKFSTIKIGGVARYFVTCSQDSHAIEAVAWAIDQGIPYFILGGGSNVLFKDDPFHGVIIHMASNKMNRLTDESFEVDAGVSWDQFVDETVRAGLFGIECLSGIPGTVGATPIQNVGAYGQEVKSVVTSVKCWDVQTKSFKTFSKDDCQFDYRHSIFKSLNTVISPRYIILSVQFKLSRKIPDSSYRSNEIEDGIQSDRKNLLTSNMTAELFLNRTRQRVLEVRRKKGMVIDETDINSRSLGSFFKNPILQVNTFNQLKDKYPRLALAPQYRERDDSIKLSAAWLIEHSGLSKGYIRGAAGISNKHCLALINPGQATARDINDLKIFIQKEVSKAFSIKLEPEPIILE